MRQVGLALERAGLARATIVGVSYGGLVATELAARHPERVSSLVLASALSTDWRPDARAKRYMRAPRLLSPIFVATAPVRLQPEVNAAFPGIGDRLRFMVRHGVQVMRAPASDRNAGGAKDAAGEPRYVAERRFVKTGQVREDRVAIISGVKEGEQVVTTGQLKLNPGAAIRVDNSQPLTRPEDRPRL